LLASRVELHYKLNEKEGSCVKPQLFSMLKRKLFFAQDTHHSSQVVRDRYKLCPSCGNYSPMSQDHAYCILCGDELIDECHRCHEPIIYPTGRFCPVCGEGLLASNERHLRHREHYQTRRHRRIEHLSTPSPKIND